MICSWCGYENLARARFCGDCGRGIQLDVVCESCSTTNPAGYSFCDACGESLVAPSGSTPIVNARMPDTSQADMSESGTGTDVADDSQKQLRSIRWPQFPTLPKPGFAWGQPQPQWHWSWSHIATWVNRNKVELILVGLLTILAGIIRIYQVTEIPDGLTGDEAWTGLDALRIVEEGWIGPYVGSALGQPTGPLYFTALIFNLSAPTTFTLHLSMALLGVATIPAAHFLFRLGFGRWVALFGTAALTFSYWHVFYSRTGFMLVSMPLMTTLAAAAILIALRSSKRWPWFIAGIILGLGIYSYNGYVSFLAMVAVFFTFILVLGRDRLKFHAIGIAILLIGFIAVAFPMLRFIWSESDFHFLHYRAVSILQDPIFTERETIGEKIEYLVGRTWDAATLLIQHTEVDGSDGMGGRGAMDPILGILAYIGLIIAALKWRSPPHLFMVITFVMGLSILILGAENWGDMRRTFVIIPFVYGLVGIAAIAGGQWAARFLGPQGKPIAYAGTAVILVAAVSLNTWTYFGRLVQEEHMDWIYASELVDALDAAHEFDDPGRIYFYAARWSYNYETRLFLYPNTLGMDRSREFGEFSLERLDDGPVTYILLPPYAEEIDALRKIHPDGEAVEERMADGRRLFSIYHLP